MYVFNNQNVFFKLFVMIYVEHSCIKVISSQFTGKVVKVCVTDACFRTAEKIKVMMKDTVKPCDNFYRFVCGSYIEMADITANMTYYYTDLDESQMDKTIQQIKHELEKPSSGHELKPFRLAKKLYRQCIALDVSGKQMIATLKKYFKSFGDWPVLKGAAWNQNGTSWVDINTKLYQNGFFSRSIMTTEIALNPVNTSQYIIQVGLPKLAIKVRHLLPGFRGSVVKTYHKYMTQVAAILGANRMEALKELKDVVKFEIELAKIINAVDNSNPDFSVNEGMQLSEIKIIFPNIPIKDIIIRTFQIKNLENISDLVINVNEPEYFMQLGRLLRQYNKRVVINYMFWRAIDGLFGDIPLLNITEHLQLIEKMYADSINPPKDEMCTEFVSKSMKIAVGALYVRKYTNKMMKSMVTQMTENLRREVIKLVMSLDWMDSKTRVRASEKVKNIDMLVAYPEEFLDDNKLEAYFEKLHLESNDNFIENLLAIAKFNKNMSFNMYGSFANRSEWKRSDSVTNIYAHYKPYENTVFIPAALLQEFYIHKDRPMYLNYGALASVIAHEILHSLDTDGQLHDKHGNAGEILFSEEARDQYQKKARALSKHYSTYIVEEVKMQLNGLKTKEESIMDQGSLKIAHASYKTWMAENGEEPRMPLLEKYTPMQLFWVSFAKTHCARLSLRELKSDIENDEHPPAEFRVNLPLRNLKVFAEDFHCPVGSFMNPSIRYNVW